MRIDLVLALEADGDDVLLSADDVAAVPAVGEEVLISNAPSDRRTVHVVSRRWEFFPAPSGGHAIVVCEVA